MAKAIDISLEELEAFSITTGAVFNEKYLLAVMTDDGRVEKDPEDRHSYIGIFRGQSWRLMGLSYPVRSQAVVSKPDSCIISVTDVGQVRRSTPAGGDEEPNVGVASGKRVLGRSRLFEVRAIAGMAWTVGTRRSVYRRTAPGRWDCLDDDCYAATDFRASFQSIHGFSSTEVYAVGARGEIWEYDGKRWMQRESGTNVTLHKVLCAYDGYVYAVGKRGTILKGRHDEWSPVADISDGYEFWSIQDYQKRIFLTANTRVILELQDAGGVALVDFDECPIPTTVYHLTVGAGRLYSFGAKHIRSFDGQEWEDVLSLD